MAHTRTHIRSSTLEAGQLRFRERLDALRRLKRGWSGVDALPPDSAAIDSAASWISCLSEEVGGTFIDPHVSVSTEGEVVFEWWRAEKKLTVYLNSESIEYVKSWGTDIVKDMEDGLIEGPDDRKAVWDWLVS